MNLASSSDTLIPHQSTIGVNRGEQAKFQAILKPKHGHHADWITVFYTLNENIDPFKLIWSDDVGLSKIANTTFPVGGLNVIYDKINKKVDIVISNVQKQMAVYITAVFVDDKTDAIKSGPLYSKFTVKFSKSFSKGSSRLSSDWFFLSYSKILHSSFNY